MLSSPPPQADVLFLLPSLLTMLCLLGGLVPGSLLRPAAALYTALLVVPLLLLTFCSRWWVLQHFLPCFLLIWEGWGGAVCYKGVLRSVDWVLTCPRAAFPHPTT